MDDRVEIDHPGRALDASIPATAGSDPGPDALIAPAISRLDDIQSRPLEEHADIYEAVHTELQRRLAGTDGSGQPGAGEESVSAAAPEQR